MLRLRWVVASAQPTCCGPPFWISYMCVWVIRRVARCWQCCRAQSVPKSVLRLGARDGRCTMWHRSASPSLALVLRRWLRSDTPQAQRMSKLGAFQLCDRAGMFAPNWLRLPSSLGRFVAALEIGLGAFRGPSWFAQFALARLRRACSSVGRMARALLPSLLPVARAASCRSLRCAALGASAPVSLKKFVEEVCRCQR